MRYLDFLDSAMRIAVLLMFYLSYTLMFVGSLSWIRGDPLFALYSFAFLMASGAIDRSEIRAALANRVPFGKSRKLLIYRFALMVLALIFGIAGLINWAFDIR